MPILNHVRVSVESPDAITYPEYAVEKRQINGKDFMICWIEAEDDERFQVRIELLDLEKFPPTYNSIDSCRCLEEYSRPIERLIGGMFPDWGGEGDGAEDGAGDRVSFVKLFHRSHTDSQMYAYPTFRHVVLWRLIAQDANGIKKAVYPKFKNVDILSLFEKLSLDTAQVADELENQPDAMDRLSEVLAKAHVSDQTAGVLALLEGVRKQTRSSNPADVFGPGSIHVRLWRGHVTDTLQEQDLVGPPAAVSSVDGTDMLVGFDILDHDKDIILRSYHIGDEDLENGKYLLANFVFIYRSKDTLAKKGFLKASQIPKPASQKPLKTPARLQDYLVKTSETSLPSPLSGFPSSSLVSSSQFDVPVIWGRPSQSVRQDRRGNRTSDRGRSASPSPSPTRLTYRQRDYGRYDPWKNHDPLDTYDPEVDDAHWPKNGE
jgi:hypothetical protein